MSKFVKILNVGKNYKDVDKFRIFLKNPKFKKSFKN